MSSTRPDGPDTEFPRSIGRPATGALAQAGYTRFAQLEHVSAATLLKLHGVGPKAIRILRGELAARGAAFAGETAGEGSQPTS